MALTITVSYKLLFADISFKILIEELIKNKSYKFFDDDFKNQFSKKKVTVKDSNFFFKDKNNETISIFPIRKINLFYDEEELVNKAISNLPEVA